MPEDPSPPTGRQKDLNTALFGFGLIGLYTLDYLYFHSIRRDFEKYSFATFSDVFVLLMFLLFSVYLIRAIADVSPDPDKPDLVSLLIEIPGVALMLIGAALQQIEPSNTRMDRGFYLALGAFLLILLFKAVRELMSLMR